MTNVLTSLEDFMKELDRRASTSPRQSKDMHFAVARTSVDALLPQDLFAYAVYHFDEAGQAVPPDGSEQRPILFAINGDQPGGVQVNAFLSSVLSTLHRQSVLESVRTDRTELAPGFSTRVGELDESARAESERLIRASHVAGHVGPIVERLTNFGWNLKFKFRVTLREGLDDVRAAMRFFGAAYNEFEAVRDVIDKFAYTVAGAGWHVVGGVSEEVRTFLESRLRSMNMAQMLAQLTRDAQLLGTGCMVFTTSSDVAARLIKPTRMKVEGWSPSSSDGRVIDEATGRSWELSEALLDRGVNQENSPYGLSILEPAMPSIYAIQSMERVVAQLQEMKRKVEKSNVRKPSAKDIQARIEVAEEGRVAAERSLKRLFWFRNAPLRLDRSELYLPGQELWTP